MMETVKGIFKLIMIIIILGLVLYPFINIKPDFDSTLENTTGPTRYPEIQSISNYVWVALPFICLLGGIIFVVIGKELYDRFGGYI